MLKITENPVFTATLPVEVPGGAAGQTVRATFRVLGRREIEKLLSEDVAGRALVTASLIRVEDVADEDGAALPWDEVAERLMDQLWFVAAMRVGYVAELARLRRGN